MRSANNGPPSGTVDWTGHCQYAIYILLGTTSTRQQSSQSSESVPGAPEPVADTVTTNVQSSDNSSPQNRPTLSTVPDDDVADDNIEIVDMNSNCDDNADIDADIERKPIDVGLQYPAVCRNSKQFIAWRTSRPWLSDVRQTCEMRCVC